MPKNHPDIEFVTYTLAKDDEIICKNKSLYPECIKASLFEESKNSKNFIFEESEFDHFTLPQAVTL